MLSIWQWNWLFESFDMPAHLPKNCFITMSPRKSLLTKANWLEHFESQWCETRHKYLPINQTVSSCRLCVLHMLQHGLQHTIMHRHWLFLKWLTSFSGRDHSWGSARRSHAFQLVTVKTGCQHEDEFCPVCSSDLCQPWQPLHLHLWSNKVAQQPGDTCWEKWALQNMGPFLACFESLTCLTFGKVCVAKQQGCFRVSVNSLKN